MNNDTNPIIPQPKTVKTKSELPLSLLRHEPASALVTAFYEYYHLKQLYRQGWLKHGIPAERCESVAEHSWGVALLAVFLGEHYPELDGLKMVRMALIHDFGEIYVGDLTPEDASNPGDKHRAEAEAIERVLGKIPGGPEYLALWQEFEAGETREARLIRQLDLLEMGIQASIYKHQGADQLAGFFEYVEARLKEDEFRTMFGEILAL